MNEVNREKKETLEKESFQNINTSAENILPTEKVQESQTMTDSSGESKSLQSNKLSSEILVVPSFPEVPNQSYDSLSSSNVESFNTNNNASLSTSTVTDTSISSSIDQTKNLSVTFPSELTQPTSSVVNESLSSATNQSSSSAVNQSPNSVTNQTISSADPAVIPIPMVDSNHDTTVSSQMNTASSPSNGNNFQPSIANYNVEEKIDDYELLGDFIGPNYQKFCSRKFNFSAFFFYLPYFYYRKMYFYPIVILLIDYILMKLLHIDINASISFFSFFYFIIYAIIIGLIFNPLYIHFAKKKVKKIRKKNQTKSIDELREICSRKGGRSIFSIFIGIVIIVIIFSLIDFIKMLFEISGFMTVLYIIFNSLHIPEILSPTYDGTLDYDFSIVIDEKFSIDVPNLFENYSDLFRYYYSYESGEGFFNNCSFEFSKVSNFYDAHNLIQQMSQYGNSDYDFVSSDFYHKKINNLDWYWFSSNSYYATTYYYATSKNNELYLLQYVVGKDTDSSCDSYRESILNSIKGK